MLLDTHVLLWLLADDPRLGPDARDAMSRASGLRASTVSLWEVAIKAETGRLTVPDDFPDRVAASGVEWVGLSAEHAWTSRRVRGLPHRDPFDRMLVAVSARSAWSLLTADRVLLSAPLDPVVELADARR